MKRLSQINKSLNLIYCNPTLFLACAIALFLFILPLKAQDNPSQDAPSTQSSEKTIINFGFSAALYSDVDIKDARVASEYWFNLMLWDKEHYKVRTVIFPDFDSILNTIKTEDVGIVTLTTLEYLRLKDKINMEPVLVGVYYNNKPTKKYILLVRNDKKLKELKDLKGKKIVMDAGISGPMEHFWLETLLLKENLPEIKDFFAATEEAQKPSQAVLPVFFGKIDAAVVSQETFDTMVELNPQLGSELISLKNSQELLPGLICFTKNLSQLIRNNTIDSALKLHDEPEAKQALVLFHVSKVITFQPSYIENTLALVKEHDELKLQSKHEG